MSLVLSRKSVALIVGLVVAGAATELAARAYRAPVTDSQWNYTGSRVACTLSHIIPQYGNAVFSRRAGEPLRLALQVYRGAPAGGEASLTIQAPHWKAEDMAVAVETVAYTAGKTPFSIAGDVAERTLTALEQGRAPTFEYDDWHGAADCVSVTVSGVNFTQAYEPFLACVRELLPYSFDDVHDRLIFYDPADTDLNKHDKEYLDRLAAFVRADAELAGTLIKDYTADLNPWNMEEELFKKRAGVVRDYLANQQVQPDRIGIGSPSASPGQGGEPWALQPHLGVNLFGPEALRAIYFDSDQFVLDDRARRTLELLVRYLKERPLRPQTLFIDGHTDDVGRRRDNRLLSKRRAQSVRRFLVSQGMPPERLKIRFFGERQPHSSNDTPQGRAKNRRVRLHL